MNAVLSTPTPVSVTATIETTEFRSEILPAPDHTNRTCPLNHNPLNDRKQPVLRPKSEGNILRFPLDAREPSSVGSVISVSNSADTECSLTITIDAGVHRLISLWVRWEPILHVPTLESQEESIQSSLGRNIDWTTTIPGNGAATVDANQHASIVLGANQYASIALWFDARTEAGVVPGDFSFLIYIETGTIPNPIPVIKVWECTLRVRHPSSFLLPYLPAIYAPQPFEATTEPAFASFLERLLLGYEDVWKSQQNMIAQIYKLFDADTTPSDFLPWLAGWMGLVLDDRVVEDRKRWLIKDIMYLYKRRGTPNGIKRYIRICTGYEPIILDAPTGWMILGPDRTATLGTGNRAKLGSLPANAFLVRLEVDADEPVALYESIVRKILNAEKPAHTTYELQVAPLASGAGLLGEKRAIER